MNLNELLDGLRALVRGLDGSTIGAADAARLVDQFSEIERLAVAGRTLATRRVQETKAWRSSGSPSIVAWVAEHSRASFRHAAATINMAMRLEQLPATKEALVSGDLSERQASERESIAALREKCRDVAAAAAGDENARERIRRSRYFRHWLETDGALRLDARLTADEGAPLLASIRHRADVLEAEAHRAGQVESAEAYAVDALASLADGAGAPKAVVHVHVSQSALARGRTEAGETCRIPGVGPISVGAARRLAAGGSVKLLEMEGVDVQRVAHAVPGCNKRRDLEIDHILPVADGGETSLDNLVRLCRWHHAQKTHHGWRLEGPPDERRWVRARAPARLGG